MRRFLAAIRFLTILPIPGTWGTAEADLSGSVPFFPIVGLLLGCIAAGAAWALSHIAPPAVVSTLIVLLLLSFSGALHMDGLSDTADGFLSSRPRERILQIMKDSHIGAMGVVAVACVLLVKFAAMASVAPRRLWAVVFLMPLAGRCAMVVHMAMLAYVRENGLGTVFYRNRPRIAAVWASLVLVLAAVLLLRWRGIAIAAAWVIVTALLALYSYRKIGGATGDTFGAACEILETIPALIATIEVHRP